MPGLAHPVGGVEDRATLQLCGEPTRATAGELGQVLSQALLDQARVVANVSRLTVGWPSALAVFGSMLSRVEGWPWARLVLARADNPLTEARHAAGWTAVVPLARPWHEAEALLEAQPAFIRRTGASTSTGTTCWPNRSLEGAWDGGRARRERRRRSW